MTRTGTGSIRILDKKIDHINILDKIKNNDQLTFYQVTIPPVNDRIHLYFMKFIVTLKNGEKIEISKLEQGRLVSSAEISASKKLSNNNIPYHYFIKSFALQLTPWQEFGYSAQISVFKFYKVLVKYLTYFFGCVITLFFMWNIIFRIKNGGFAHLMTINAIVLIELLGVIVCRMLYYAAVDATMFPINLDRHLFASNILYIPMLIVVLYKICYFLKNKSFNSFK